MDDKEQVVKHLEMVQGIIHSRDCHHHHQVVKHLEMIQGIINRLRYETFLIKGWSMAAAYAIFTVRNDIKDIYVLLAFLIPIFGFWILDGYFLWQERLFKEVYNDIRKKYSTDFAMDIGKHRNKPKCSWLSSIFSVTLLMFYGIGGLFVLVVVHNALMESSC